MRWERRGLCFRTSEHRFLGAPMQYAQSPQALVCDDHVRVYFSTRTRDEGGQYLSHIGFVDFDLDFGRIIRVAQEPVVALGALGCFDEHGIFPMNVVRHGSSVYGFTCGWSRRKSVPVETSIGVVVSRDGGETFGRLGDGPILTASLAEPFLVGDPFVQIYEGLWHMWYIAGTKWIEQHPLETAPARVYKLRHATSSEGLSWRIDNERLIDDALGEDECQALPTVIKRDDGYHMYFCYRGPGGFRDDKAQAYRLGYAHSSDLRRWTRADARGGMERPPEGWDSEMQCYPHLVWCGGRMRLLYNGNSFGRDGFGLATLRT
jgi:hypothetical protein